VLPLIVAVTLIQWVGIFFTQFSTAIFNLLAGLMFLITQYDIAVGIGELNGQSVRIDTVQHALDGGRWHQCHGIIK
jgi:hypothetical protein